MTMLSDIRVLKPRRGLALVIALILALSLLLSAAFVLVELHHACTGEHCEICLAVAHSVQYLKAQGIARLLPLTSVSFGFTIALFFCFAQRKPSCASSPVSLKVKLSD
jgi:hypothetical protein